jgi:hypothetical protein
MKPETPDERIPQDPGIPAGTPRDPPEPEPADGSELPAEPEAPDQEGQRAFEE